MEFYKSIDNESFCRISFNSQRDGILLCVSVLVRLVIVGFNSQRDGILHRSCPHPNTATGTVSIPNGMEFYGTRSWGYQRVRIVSIPNGMEFYQGEFKPKPFSVVSIPNGMEFYQNGACQSERKKQFQFPTGWNSTLRRADFKAWYVFQFPTGWNSTGGSNS